MYKFTDELNGNFFRFDKNLVLKKRWAKLPKASKAIFPIIGVHCNAQGWAFPSERTIAVLAGVCENTVREGIKGLKRYRFFAVDTHVTSRGHRANKYFIKPPPKNKGASAFFYKAVVIGGNWLHLIPSAKALYPVLKIYAFYDYLAYIEEVKHESETAAVLYEERDFDFVQADLDVMAEYAGLSQKSVKKALENLEEHSLIEEAYPIDGHQTWKLYEIPPRRYEADYLNQVAAKRYKKTSK
jgi:DNA-binding transcriptional regulator YhcF (GntR family)